MKLLLCTKGDTPWHLWRQHVAALLANLAAVCGGVALGWSAAALPPLQAGTAGPGRPRLSLDQASWVGSLASLGALLGALPAGLLAQRIGRRRALLALAAPFLAGSLMLTLADSIWMLYVGRLLTGLCIGGSAVLVALYCEEMAEVRIRGALGTYFDLLVCVGIMWAYVMGVLLSYLWYNISCCAVPIAFVAGFYWMPESPVFLADRGRLADARAALLWFRNAGPDFDPQPELDAIVAAFGRGGGGGKAGAAGVEDGSGGGNSGGDAPGSSLLSCCASNTARTLRMVFGLMFFQQGSGITAVTYYAIQIFEEAGSSIPVDTSLLILAVMNVVGTLVSTLCVERCGRKPLLFASCFVMGLSLVALALHARFGEGTLEWGWVPLAAILVYIVMYSVGMGPLPWFMMAELFPMQSKTWATSICVCFNRIVTFVVTKEFLPLGVLLGKDAVYGALAVVCFLGGIYSLTCVLETKGKPREQIQLELQGKYS